MFYRQVDETGFGRVWRLFNDFVPPFILLVCVLFPFVLLGVAYVQGEFDTPMSSYSVMAEPDNYGGPASLGMPPNRPPRSDYAWENVNGQWTEVKYDELQLFRELYDQLRN